jgi:hypothetical protein
MEERSRNRIRIRKSNVTDPEHWFQAISSAGWQRVCAVVVIAMQQR